MSAGEAMAIAPERGASEWMRQTSAPTGSGEPFSAFLASTGHRVLNGAGAYWYDASPGFFLSLPSHRLLQPSAEELRALLRHQPCAGVRFPAPLEGPGKLSYQIVCDAPGYGIDSLSANARSKVRRGQRRGTVVPVPFATIAAEGIAADRDTLARQGRAVKLDEHLAHRRRQAGLGARRVVDHHDRLIVVRVLDVQRLVGLLGTVVGAALVQGDVASDPPVGPQP
jgi:hypothetical protein